MNGQSVVQNAKQMDRDSFPVIVKEWFVVRRENLVWVTMVCVALLVSGCVLNSTYEEDTQRLRDIISDLDGKNKRITQDRDRLQSVHDQCLADLTQMNQEKGTLSGDLQEAMNNLEELRKIAENRKQMLESIVSSLRTIVSAGHVRVVQRDGRLVVQIAENILFDTGKSELKEEGQEALAELAPVLVEVNRDFQVTGHTDNVGEEEKNWNLSVDRALSVLIELVKGGFPSNQISAAGYAYFQPISENETEEGRQKNRRVDLVLVPNLQELNLPELSSGCLRYLDVVANSASGSATP